MRKTLSMKLTAMAITSALAIAPALAQTTGGTTTVTTTTSTTPSTTTTAGTKLSGSFSDWAGSPENSAALVKGLRTGQPITLSSAPTGSTGGVATATTFTAPTKPMGYGNVRIALSLAQQQLASQGITQPTPQQLQTALMGGQLTTLNGTTVQTTDMQGVLQMRASGMGWGKIANTMGYKLGAVMSGKAAATPVTTTASSSSGITTAAGGSAGAGSTKTQHGKAGSGIVTASGGAGGGISTGIGGGHGNAGTGSGIVSAHGGGSGAQGQSHGGGQGKGGK